MSFESNVKTWVAVDNELRNLNEKVKDLREKRNHICSSIMTHVESNNLENATIKISDGILKFASSKQTAPLTLKYVESCLNECIDEPCDVKAIMEHIKNKREHKFSSEIKRNYD